MKKSAAESEIEFEERLKVNKESADKACSDAESNMKKKVEEVDLLMAAMQLESEKFQALAIQADAARMAILTKSKEEDEATKLRITQLRAELMDLEPTELNFSDSASRDEILPLLEELIGEKVTRINRLAAVTAEFYKLQKTLHFPASEPLNHFLLTLPSGLPENPSRRVLQLRSKQIFMASLNSTHSLPPPFVLTRAYIEALEDRRDNVRDEAMEYEANESDCKHVIENIVRLWEQLNIPPKNRQPLVMDPRNLNEYTVLANSLQEQWEVSKQGEVDKDRLQAIRDELLDLTETEFLVQNVESKEERWANLELLVTEKVKRISDLARLTSELCMIPDTSSKTPFFNSLKPFLDSLRKGLPDPPTLDALQTRAKEILTSSFATTHSLPKPLSIARSCAQDIQKILDDVKKAAKEKLEKEELVRRLIGDIRALWSELEVDENERVALVEDVTKIGEEEQDAFWDRCKPIYSPTALSEMLKEIANVTLRRERSIKIRKLIQERKEFIQKLIEFEKAAQDPSRFSGSSIRLLEEEKFRKSALPNLKKMENSIRKQLNEFEEATDHAFTVDNQPYLEILDNEVKDRLSNASVLVFFSKKG
ncbi:hypothetical protein HDU98_008387 [Podochytrium sp. JEL0797]|nr:hypothetical protein HDU98_008387 [Podochytrium sp. JEL0797]